MLPKSDLQKKKKKNTYRDRKVIYLIHKLLCFTQEGTVSLPEIFGKEKKGAVRTLR